MEDLHKLLKKIHSLVESDGSQEALAAFRIISDGAYLIGTLRHSTGIKERELCSILQDAVVSACGYIGMELSEEEMKTLTSK